MSAICASSLTISFFSRLFFSFWESIQLEYKSLPPKVKITAANHGAARGDHEFAASDFAFLFAPGK